MDTDAIIAEANLPADAQSQPETTTAVTEDATKETPVTEEVNPETEAQEPGTEEAESKTDEELFPKKAVNALSRRDKKIGKLQAEKQALMQEIEALRKGASKPEIKESTEIKEEDFATYGEYLKAVAREEAKQEYQKAQKEQQELKQKGEAESWRTERIEALEDNAAEAKKAFPDFDRLADEALKAANLGQHVIDAFLEAENPAFALYSLVKENSLDSLNDMSPARVAMAIARAEDKGLALSKTKQISKAPQPLSPAKGVTPTGKDLSSLSFMELKKELKLK